jgi:hypothetical protein
MDSVWAYLVFKSLIIKKFTAPSLLKTTTMMWAMTMALSLSPHAFVSAFPEPVVADAAFPHHLQPHCLQTPS